MFEPFTKSFIDTTFADESGIFKFDTLPEGFYNLTARNFNADSGTIITSICINKLNSREIRKASEYAALGSITGTTFINSESTGFVLVYVIGTDFRDTADIKGVYTIEKVPPGIYKISGTFAKTPKPGQIEYYSSISENITVQENVESSNVDLNLERIK
jgi:hypothetical protein